MKWLKVGKTIINLAHVQSIELKEMDNGACKLYLYSGDTENGILDVFYGDVAKYVWEFINEHLDMTVCPILQEVTK
mgnify:CR=1 FL=1